LRCPAFEAFYGGARGGGKTEGLLMDYAKTVNCGWGEAWKGIIFRKTYKQLDEIIARSKKYFYSAFLGSLYTESNYTWWFRKGETLRFRYVEREADAEHYQGHEYPFVGFEELTNWPMDTIYEKLKATCRSSTAGIPKRVRSTGNPVGPGHHWVKNYFIDPMPPMIPIVNAQGLSRIFIPARVYDNLALMKNDPMYVKQLEGIKDENLRKAWLLGDWNVVAGGFFGDIWDQDKNVIRTFIPPRDWLCFRAFDWGSAKPFSVGWWTISDGTEAPDHRFYPRGALIRFAEWYGCKEGEANVGVRMHSPDIAKEILVREGVWKHLSIYPGPADPSIFVSEDGPSIADRMGDVGVYWERADNKRIPGWQQMRERIEGDGEKPMLYVMDRCRDFLRTVPVIGRDERVWDDVDTDAEDHVADEARYAVMFKGPKVSAGQRFWK